MLCVERNIIRVLMQAHNMQYHAIDETTFILLNHIKLNQQI